MSNTVDKFGVLAEFDGPKALYHAAEAVRDAGYQSFDVYSPFPIHGMNDAMGMADTKLPWLVLGGGLAGLIGGFTLQGWVSTSAYRLIISGKPFFSYPAFIPVTFELMVLCAAFATVFGMFAMNKLPEWYHSLHKEPSFKTVTSHGFFLAIESDDPKYDASKVKAFLEKIGGTGVKEINS